LCDVSCPKHFAEPPYLPFRPSQHPIVATDDSFDGKQGIEYELGWRRLTDASSVASPAVVAQLDDYVKSALKYSWTAGNKEVDNETGQVRW
jgi:hypothetical protein